MTPVVLRPVQLADGDVLHAIFTEPGVRRYLFDDFLLTRVETDGHVAAAVAHGAWAIWQDGRIVGLTSLRPMGGERELMIVLSERCWGRGVAFEAARTAMRHGFDTLRLDRILATVDLPNGRSHRLMTRLGFVPIGESDGPVSRARNYEALRRSGT